MRLRKAAVTLGGSLLPTLAVASPDLQASAFMDIYASHCIKYLHDFDGLRRHLGAAPRLSPDKAAVFLKGSQGNAWMVPSPHGQFILVINQDKQLCALYAKTVPAAPAQELFEKVVSNAPAPFRSKQMRNTSSPGTDGVTRTVAYEWSTDSSPRKPLFSLTVTTNPKSVAQGVAIAALGH
ncbi:NMCC_0638 family (lipo)protein [Massilia sp. DD77]|uniref:NMCC_0638 family (lipo)protein n=1 Tax=Massilia sp. DD77 TaxID=3109349 RepID=UPI003000F42A